MTPKQISASVALVIERKNKERADALYVSTMAQRGESREITKLIKEWQA